MVEKSAKSGYSCVVLRARIVPSCWFFFRSRKFSSLQLFHCGRSIAYTGVVVKDYFRHEGDEDGEEESWTGLTGLTGFKGRRKGRRERRSL